MSSRQESDYRPCAGLMLRNEAGKIFVGQRLDSRVEAWQMPQGGIDEGETPLEAAFRELREETGTNKAELIAEALDWLYYDLPEHLQKTLWNGRYKGQRQRWFLFRFTGQDADINIQTEHPEFRAWQWVEPAHLPGLIVPFKRALYEQVLGHFAAYLR